MFTTYRDAEMVISGLEDSQKSQVWRCVEQELIQPWFYLQVGRRLGSEVSTSMMMVGHAHELRELVDRQSPHIWLDEVMFVTPPHINRQERWLMEPLQKICIFRLPRSNEFELQYDVTGGRSYFLNGTNKLQRYTLVRVLFDVTRDLSRPGADS